MGVRLVGIVNVTPDSFSDGGRSFAPEDAYSAIIAQQRAGAEVVDVGAESTRPGAQPLSWQEEWKRLEPVLKLLPPKEERQFKLSLDSRHAETVERALAYGIEWINDVSGFSHAPMVRLAAGCGCKLVVMHSLGVPASREALMHPDADVVAEVLAFGRQRIAQLEGEGISRERIIFDVGVGFGKSAEQSVALMRGISAFRELGVGLLVGHSRKSFLPAWGLDVQDKDAATLEISRYLVAQGVDYLRVHDVRGHAELAA